MSFQNAKILCLDANSEEYHAQDAKPGTPGYAMSSSDLRVFGQCPARYVAGYEPPESEAKDWGQLLDALLLTPKQFKERFAVKPATYVNEKGEEKPWNGNSNVCKQWLEDHASKTVISAADLANAGEAMGKLHSDETIHSYLDCSDKQVWLTGEWKDEATGLIVPVKALLDLVPRPESEFGKTLGDLKTTRNGSLMAWQRWCYQAGYHIQAGFYYDLYRTAKPDEDRTTFCFILQENFSPWQTAKRMLNHEFLELGQFEYRRLLTNYCQCLKYGQWPGYDDTDESVQGWGLVSAEPFMQERTMFAPKFQFADEQPVPEYQDENQGVIP